MKRELKRRKKGNKKADIVVLDICVYIQKDWIVFIDTEYYLKVYEQYEFKGIKVYEDTQN